LILRKIIKILATRCQILRLKCTKFDFGWGSAPDPAGGAYSAPPDPLAGFKGPTSKGRQGRGRKGSGKRKGREGKKEGRGRGDRDGRESLGGQGGEGKGVGKRGGEGKFRGGQAPQMFFPRTAPASSATIGVVLASSRRTTLQK